VEADHLDYYRSLDEIYDAIRSFVAGVPPHGAVVVCADDPGARAIANAAAAPVVTYGLSEDAYWRAVIDDAGPYGVKAHLYRGREPAGSLTLAVGGRHNVRNALAAIAVADRAGVSAALAGEELATFGGVARRFELRGVAGRVTVVDDYAHHPTEVDATLSAARERGWKRIVAVFQPHRYSRTKVMGHALGRALAAADTIVVTDVYGAGEPPIAGVTGKVVVDGLLEAAPQRRVAYLPAGSDIASFVASRARAGDLVMTIGAGDVTALGPAILDRLSARSG
jgi:UDP-N-acetylmuramate--alanine ligase